MRLLLLTVPGCLCLLVLLAHPVLALDVIGPKKAGPSTSSLYADLHLMGWAADFLAGCLVEHLQDRQSYADEDLRALDLVLQWPRETPRSKSLGLLGVRAAALWFELMHQVRPLILSERNWEAWFRMLAWLHEKAGRKGKVAKAARAQLKTFAKDPKPLYLMEEAQC